MRMSTYHYILLLATLLVGLTACQNAKNTIVTKTEQTSMEKDGSTASTSPSSMPAKPTPRLAEQPSEFAWRWDADEDEYRKKNWMPEKGKYYFSEVWSWSYQNDLVEAGEFGHKGQLDVYVDTPTGTILVANTENKGTMLDSEQIDYVLALPDGTYISCYKGPHGEKGKLIKKPNKFQELQKDSEFVVDNFNNYFRPLREKENFFGANKYNNPTLVGTPYSMRFAKSNDESKVYLARLPISALPLYLFNERGSSEGNLPINFNYANSLPENYWVLAESYTQNGKTYRMYLESMSPTQFFFDLNEY